MSGHEVQSGSYDNEKISPFLKKCMDRRMTGNSHHSQIEGIFVGEFSLCRHGGNDGDPGLPGKLDHRLGVAAAPHPLPKDKHRVTGRGHSIEQTSYLIRREFTGLNKPLNLFSPVVQTGIDLHVIGVARQEKC